MIVQRRIRPWDRQTPAWRERTGEPSRRGRLSFSTLVGVRWDCRFLPAPAINPPPRCCRRRRRDTLPRPAVLGLGTARESAVLSKQRVLGPLFVGNPPGWSDPPAHL